VYSLEGVFIGGCGSFIVTLYSLLLGSTPNIVIALLFQRMENEVDMYLIKVDGLGHNYLYLEGGHRPTSKLSC